MSYDKLIKDLRKMADLLEKAQPWNPMTEEIEMKCKEILQESRALLSAGKICPTCGGAGSV